MLKAGLQLRMLFDGKTQKTGTYTLDKRFIARPFRPEDSKAYEHLRKITEFNVWSEEEESAFLKNNALPDGLLVAEEISTGKIVASAAAEYGKVPEPFLIPGTLGWVMTDPEYRGCGLCKYISNLATQKLIDNGIMEHYLLTDDFRLPAISCYLKLGWRPWMFFDDMPARWAAIFEKLGRSQDELEKIAVHDPLAKEIMTGR